MTLSEENDVDDIVSDAGSDTGSSAWPESSATDLVSIGQHAALASVFSPEWFVAVLKALR